jgi:predicted O-methyltransferase YrrM
LVQIVLLALWAAVTIASLPLALHGLRARANRRERNVLGRWPVPTRPLTALDPIFRVTDFGPTRDAEVVMIGRGGLNVPGGTTDTEAWILSALAKRATLMFEFGTCTGKTTYLWARNAPADAKVVTVTLRPEDRSAYVRAAADDERDTSFALRESEYDEFVYSGTDVQGKVVQLFGDSKELDVSPWAGRCDLVFVDGSHAYSYVTSDSRKALELVRPGGIVLWHDYAGPRHSKGVYRGLNELVKERDLFHVAGTTFVAYRRPL